MLSFLLCLLVANPLAFVVHYDLFSLAPTVAVYLFVSTKLCINPGIVSLEEFVTSLVGRLKP